MACFKEAQLWFGFDLLSIMGKSRDIAENINQNYSDERTSLAISMGPSQQPKSLTILAGCEDPENRWPRCLSPRVSLLLPTRTAELVP